MRLTLKLNLENFENQDFETNEYSNIEDCYREQIIFLKGWVEFTPYARPILDHILSILGSEGEKYNLSPNPGDRPPDSCIDSKPLEKTTVVESQNFVDVRECKDYSDKAYKLIGYDNLETYIAKQHVVRTESIEGGGTRVVVSQKSAWAITKLEWK